MPTGIIEFPDENPDEFIEESLKLLRVCEANYKIGLRSPSM